MAQLDQSDLHIVHPHDMSCRHGTFRRLPLCSGTVRKKTLTLGNQLVSLIQPTKIPDMAEIHHSSGLNSQSGAVDRAMIGLCSLLYAAQQQRPSKLKFDPTLQ